MADLCAHLGLDKSTLSRQFEQLISTGLRRRAGERPGRRGNVLALTPVGEQHLAAAAQAVGCHLAEWLSDWSDRDIATFAGLITRFNLSRTGLDRAGGAVTGLWNQLSSWGRPAS